MISGCFEPHLGLYVESKDRSLREMIDSYRRANGELDTGIKVLSSSMDLVYFYQETITQAEKWTTGKAFLELYNVLGKRLQQYADQILSPKLPK